MVIGRLNDETLAVVFAALGTQGLSVISMRPASRKERSPSCPTNRQSPSPTRKRPVSRR